LSRRFKSLAFSVALICVLTGTSVLRADVRDHRLCVAANGFQESRFGATSAECFSGHVCVVGVRGDWLDLTDRVTVESGPTARITIRDTGTGDARGAIGTLSTCVPTSTRSREGYVSILLADISGSGTMRLKLSRPNAIGGRDDDTVSLVIKKGETYIALDTPYNATFGEPKELVFRGGNLDLLQLKNPEPGDEILSKSETEARVRLTFTRENSRTNPAPIENRLQFAGPEPALNERFGWPRVNVSGGSSRSTPVASSSQTNIKPLNPSALLRPVDLRAGTGLQTGKIDDSFCAGLVANEVREMAVPPFRFSVQNMTGRPIAETFAVALTDRSGRTLYTEDVQGLGANATKVISVPTWQGRQARFTVKNSQATPCPTGPCGVMAGRVHGCFLDSSMTGRVTPDISLVIRVDPDKAIPNEAIGDNALGVN
jgi:hypothetical protein